MPATGKGYSYTNYNVTPFGTQGFGSAMPTELRSRIHTPYTGRLDLPPGFKEVPLRESGDA